LIRTAGDHGLLVETGSLTLSHALDALLRAERPAGVEEIVPGPEAVLVVSSGPGSGALRTLLEALLERARANSLVSGTRAADDADARVDETDGAGAPGDRAAAGVVTVPVVYDGADLADVAALAGITVAETIARHTGTELVVGWLGFAPGFAYLTGLDPLLRVSRLATPRTSVPAGSVAIAGPYSAVYPTASPGGWRLLGRTDLRVWDITADPPSLFRPGTRVRFEAR